MKRVKWMLPDEKIDGGKRTENKFESLAFSSYSVKRIIICT